MGKTKAESSSKGKTFEKAASPVKNGGVIKSTQNPKSKSKELAKAVAAKAEKKLNGKKKQKEPTPESSSGSEDNTDDEMESDSDSPSEAEQPKKATNGATKAKATVDTSESSESSDADSESESESESESDDEVVIKTVTISAGEKVAADDSASDDESDSDSEDEAPKKAANGRTNGAAKKAGIDDSSEEDFEGSDDSTSADSDESDDESDSEEEAVPKKRKAEDNLSAGSKKTKNESTAMADDAPKNLFVGNLSWSVDEDMLSREFEEFGELAGTRIITDRESGRSKGFGYVEFVNAADAARALEAKKGALIEGREANVDFSVPRTNDTGANPRDRANSRAQSYGDSLSQKSDTLFIGNISFNADQDSVAEAFGQFATVQSVRLPTDQETGNPKGFGYVQFYSVEDAEKALTEGAGMTIVDRAVRLDYSTPRPANDSPRGRGGFRGGDRGGSRGRGGFDRGGRGGGRGGGFNARGGRGGFNDRGGRGGGRGASTNRGGFGAFRGSKQTFD